MKGNNLHQLLKTNQGKRQGNAMWGIYTFLAIWYDGKEGRKKVGDWNGNVGVKWGF